MLVVDDASLDDSQGVVTGVGARVITIESNQGLAAARNRGAQAAAGNVLWLVESSALTATHGEFQLYFKKIGLGSFE